MELLAIHTQRFNEVSEIKNSIYHCEYYFIYKLLASWSEVAFSYSYMTVTFSGS